MTDRFDLEQQIMACWNIVEDLDYILELDPIQNNDKAMNVILGMKELYSLKFEKCFDTFSKLIAARNI